MSPERLNKALAAAGVASRRDCDEMIAAGRISVNGHIVHELGSRVDLDTDTVLVDGQPLQRVDERVYIMLHKPVGVVSTADDPQGRPTVVDMVPDAVRLFPVGRLDANSSGLLLLTNDGELAHNLTHPSFEVEKEYRVLLNEAPDSETLREWRHGVMLEGERTAPAWVDVQEQTDDGVWVRVVLREGRKRQIREVAKLLGYNVLQLIRVREGSLLLGDLAEGAWRKLTPDEVRDLRTHTPTPPEPRSRGERMAARSDLRGLGAMGAAAGAAASQREHSDQQNDRPPRRDSREGGSYSDRPPRRDSREGGNGGRYSDRPPRRDSQDSRESRDSRDNQGSGARPARPAGGSSGTGKFSRRPSNKPPKGARSPTNRAGARGATSRRPSNGPTNRPSNRPPNRRPRDE